MRQRRLDFCDAHLKCESEARVVGRDDAVFDVRRLCLFSWASSRCMSASGCFFCKDSRLGRSSCTTGGLDVMVSLVARNGECSLSNAWTGSTPMSSRRGRLLGREHLAGDSSGPSTGALSGLGSLSGCQSLPDGDVIVGRAPPVALWSLPISGNRSHSISFN